MDQNWAYYLTYNLLRLWSFDPERIRYMLVCWGDWWKQKWNVEFFTLDIPCCWIVALNEMKIITVTEKQALPAVSFNCTHLNSMIILTNNKLHMSSELTKIIKYFNCNCLYLLLQFTIKLFILLLLFWVQTYLYMLKKRKIAKFNKLQFHLSLKITKSKYPWNMAHDFLQNMIIAKLS